MFVCVVLIIYVYSGLVYQDRKTDYRDCFAVKIKEIFCLQSVHFAVVHNKKLTLGLLIDTQLNL